MRYSISCSKAVSKACQYWTGSLSNLFLFRLGNINFQTEGSGMTLLILAARFRRHDIISKLISKKVNVSAKDRYERSALFYASRNGDLNSVRALMGAKASPDDGSLHEAARELHSDIVEALTDPKHKIKHNVMLQSTMIEHGRRIAFDEMLLRCDPETGGLSKTESTIRALAKAMLLAKKDFQLGEDEFFRGLNNAKPVTLLKALLNCGLKKQLQDGDLLKKFTAKNGAAYYYSPTTYILRGLSYGPIQQPSQVLSYLYDQGVKDCFYAPMFEWQPPDSQNMPAPIRDDHAARVAESANTREYLRHQLQQNQQIRFNEARVARKRKIIDDLQMSFGRERGKLELRFQQEDNDLNSLHASAQAYLRNMAIEMSRDLDSHARFAPRTQDQSKLVQQHRERNWRIQQGNASERREHHMNHLIAQRASVVQAGVNNFSARERIIAGWH